LRRREPAGLHTVTKRWFDVVVSTVLLVLTAPLMGGIALLVRWRLGPPALFRQWRPGLHEKGFELLKFRTMTDACDAQGKLLPDKDRLTRLGRLLRLLSVDELPQLWNVLRGDLSLVGPRPLLMQYLRRYSHEQARRHDVRPGITGWAQINGRNAITWEQKFALDLWYVDHWSFWLDIKILWLTAKKIIRPKDVSARGHATMSEFRGNCNSGETPCGN
jgi:sugar transferase EpsL